MNRTEKILGTVFCLTIMLFIYFSNRDESKKNEIINKNKFSTIAKVYKIESGKNYTYAHFCFFCNEKEYYSSEFITNDLRKSLNRYYKVDLSSVEPKYSKIHLDQEIIDSTEIIKAGFTLSPN